MKIFALVLLSAIFACASAGVRPEMWFDGPVVGEDGEILRLEDVDTNGGLSGLPGQSPVRHVRFTCDILSFQSAWFSANNSACGLRCLLQGKRGGSCSNGVCNCRG